MCHPTLDYAASVWFGPGKRGTERLLNRLGQVQRLGARITLRAFRQVSLGVLEAEACLETARDRLTWRTAKHAAKLLAADQDNPAREALLINTWANNFRYCSPLQHTLKTHQKHLQQKGSTPITSDPAWVQAPWEDWTPLITIRDEVKAIQECKSAAAKQIDAVYIYASCRNGLSGIGVIQHTRFTYGQLQGLSVGRQNTCSVLAAELTGIRQALQLGYGGYISTDSTKALAAIRAGNKAISCRAILRDISRLLCQRARSYQLPRLAWSPGHKGIPGNEKANTVARQATAVQGEPTAPVDERIRELKGVLQLMEKDRSDNPTLTRRHRNVGQYTWQLDRALPGKHTLALYNISSEEASVLIQMRTGHCRLNQSLHRLRIVDTADCQCGEGEESIQYVLLHCPRWTAARAELQAAAGDRWGDVSYLLGGWGLKKHWETGEPLDGPKEKWKPDLKVVKQTIRFLQHTGRLAHSQTGQE
jgi:ribonuclease HI